MNIAMLFGVITVAIFVLAFLSNRRFGVLALSLAVGSMLAEFWTKWLGKMIDNLGFGILGLPNAATAALVLLIAPLMLLMFGGPKYHGKLQRIISAVATALLTAALLSQPLSRLEGIGGEDFVVYKFMRDWWQYIATVGLVAGLIDVFLLHSAKSSHPKRTKH